MATHYNITINIPPPNLSQNTPSLNQRRTNRMLPLRRSVQPPPPSNSSQNIYSAFQPITTSPLNQPVTLNINEVSSTNLNRNARPFDPRSPFITSGIRMGTPAVTTCGMKENELTQVGYLISEIMKNRSDENKLNELEAEVRSLATSFQPYG